MKQSKINALSEPLLLGFHVLAPTTECSTGICSSCSLLTCPECRTGGLRQLQSHGEKPWMNPRSSPTRACQLPLVGLAFLQRRIQGKASWIKGSYSSPGKNHGSEAALWPLSTHAWLSCTAKPPLTVFGTAEPNTPHAWPQLCSASLLQEPGDPSFSLSEPGRKLSRVGHVLVQSWDEMQICC